MALVVGTRLARNSLVEKMWNHVEISKLYEYCQGESLGEADLHHLARCEFCQELVAFFEDRLREIANSESKAA